MVAVLCQAWREISLTPFSFLLPYLERQLQAKLDLAAGGGGGDHSSSRARDGILFACCGCRALLRTGAEDHGIRRCQVRVVEHIEELRAELCPEALMDGSGFCQREVEIGKTGTGERISAQIADRAG